MQWGRWHTALPLLPWQAPVAVLRDKADRALREANLKNLSSTPVKATQRHEVALARHFISRRLAASGFALL
jgi:hypothetical protein